MIKQLTVFLFAAVAVHGSSAQVLPNFKKAEPPKQKVVTTASSSQKNSGSKPVKKIAKEKADAERYVENYSMYNAQGLPLLYTGNIKNGLPNGRGTLYFRDNNLLFDGYLVNGKYIEGIVYLKNKKWKEGAFDENEELTGYGKYYFFTGVSHNHYYEGNFNNGRPDGAGKVHYENGGIYTGEFDSADWSRPKGKGNLKNSTKGYECIGIFENGNFSEGEIRFNDGSRCVGKEAVFINSTNTGNTGSYYFANGDVYQGEFWNYMMHGKGTYTMSDGTRFTGIFIDNHITDRDNDTGELFNGTATYRGIFKLLADGKLHLIEEGTKKTIDL